MIRTVHYMQKESKTKRLIINYSPYNTLESCARDLHTQVCVHLSIHQPTTTNKFKNFLKQTWVVYKALP